MESSSQTKQLQIRFITKQEQYSVADTPFAVPATISVVELNNLVNHLLKESNVIEGKDVNFDFIAASEFVRSPLGEHLETRGHSTEVVVDIEYLERLPAPQPQDCLLHDDWVSSAHTSKKWIVSGCYDNTVHLWSIEGTHIMTIPGHTGAVKAVSWISQTEDDATFLSGSHDQTVLLWQWKSAKNEIECIRVCKGHSKSIECIGVSPDKTRFASGSWDNMLKIWSTSMDDDDDEPTVKRKPGKMANIKTPLVTLKGHKEAVSGLSWKDNTEMATCSWDHTIRIWDTEMSSSIQEMAGTKAFFDIDWSQLNHLLITASSDKNIKLYDPRSKEGQVCKTTFSSHRDWVMSVKWSKMKEHLFISSSNDKTVKLWDTRSSQVPMFDMTGHSDKVLSCDWSQPELVVSGGADNTLRIFKVSNEI